MSIWKFLGLDKEKGSAEPLPNTRSADTETVRKIVAALDQMEPERARYIAAFAYNLSRVAHADRNISPEETREMERIVMERGNLPEEQALIVVQMAKSQSIFFGGTENYVVTREFNQLATREQKIALLHCLFAVSAADQSISSVESSEIRQIANELKLRHKEFIEARVAYQQYLAVLKKKPGPVR